MKTLLLIAHGSRRQSSNDEIGELAAQIRNAGAFELVEHAFLEMAAPSIVEGGDKLAAGGATEIVVLPYFLAAGQHILVDIPAQVAELEQRHPEIEFITVPHLGAASGMRELICEHLRGV